MMIIYFVMVLFVWVALKVTTNYKVLLFVRRFLDVSFYIVCVWASVSLVVLPIGNSLINATIADDVVRIFGKIIGLYCMIPFFYRIWKRLWHIVLYDSSHIKNIERFTLYLRGFKEDKKRKLTEFILMDSLCKYLYVPYAIGRPNEMTPSSHSIPLYIGDDWKDRVEEMMQKAPLILLRVSDTKNFLWELGTCITKKYIRKSLFWVTDKNSYSLFRTYCIENHGFYFPKMDDVSKNCIIFISGSEFQICHLSSKKSYKTLCVEIIDKFKFNADSYLYKRDIVVWSWLFRFRYDESVLKGIQKWDWIAFLFPEFYMMIHRFKWTRFPCLLIIDFVVLLISVFFSKLFGLDLLILVCFIIFRLPIMLLSGKNSRTMEWYEEKWPSVAYFNKVSKQSNIKTVAFVFGFILLCLPIWLL